MARRKPNYRKGKSKDNPLSADDYAKYLHDDEEHRQQRKIRPPSRWKRIKEGIAEFLDNVHMRGRERLTIMVIPHTEQKIFNLHVSLYTIATGLVAVLIVLLVSVFSLVGKSGKEIQFYDMGLTNSQFNQQSIKMAEEIIPLHAMISEYTATIADLHLKLDGSEADVAGQGGVAQTVADSEVARLKNLVDECRAQGDDCGQELTEEILRRVIYISEQDNHNLQRAVEISDGILKDLETREKKNLLANTPSIWPTHGYLMSPYGMRVDADQGREYFQRGIEIGAMPGTEVLATAPGRVEEVQYDSTRGLQLRIRHRYGIQTYYAHLDRLRIKKGDRVNKGQVVGYVGRSGMTPVYKLYYEVHVGTVAYNPHAFLNHLQDQWLIQPRT